MKERKFDLAVDKVKENREQGTKGSKKRHILILNDPFTEDGRGAKMTISSSEPFDGFAPNHGVTVIIKNPQKTLDIEEPEPKK